MSNTTNPDISTRLHQLHKAVADFPRYTEEQMRGDQYTKLISGIVENTSRMEEPVSTKEFLQRLDTLAQEIRMNPALGEKSQQGFLTRIEQEKKDYFTPSNAEISFVFKQVAQAKTFDQLFSAYGFVFAFRRSPEVITLYRRIVSQAAVNIFAKEVKKSESMDVLMKNYTIVLEDPEWNEFTLRTLFTSADLYVVQQQIAALRHGEEFTYEVLYKNPQLIRTLLVMTAEMDKDEREERAKEAEEAKQPPEEVVIEASYRGRRVTIHGPKLPTVETSDEKQV